MLHPVFLVQQGRRALTATIDDQCKIIIKIAQTYNVFAHKLCSANRFASKLLYANKRMIYGWFVIELIEGVSLHDAQLTNKEYFIVMNEFTIETLCSAGIFTVRTLPFEKWIRMSRRYCLNLIFVKNIKSAIINRPLISSIIECSEWPLGAQPYKLLDKSHDLYWLDYLREENSSRLVDISSCKFYVLLLYDLGLVIYFLFF